MNPYLDFLVRSGQIEKVRLDPHERTLDRGFCLLLGVILGLIVAYWIR